MTDSKLWVVSYLSNGHFKATRHREGCSVLAMAQRQHEERSYNTAHVKQQAVVEDERYTRLVARGVAVAAKDHACVNTPAVVDADLKTLEIEQESAELRRYYDALAAREEMTVRIVVALQELWAEMAGPSLDWHPNDHVIRQFLNRYEPRIVEAAVRDLAPKVASGYADLYKRGKWHPYMWSVMKNMALAEEVD